MSKLIELDAAIAETWKDTGYSDPLNVMTAIRDRLEALPLVDAVEAVHGKWVNTDDGFRCNRCNHHAPRSNGIWLSNFCPDCGADMRGDEDD